ncbi:MAG TPA: LysR family transcriptional regulator [Terracidiphilus sp.]|nr:LysR family transcriptional regulator [Terracidiphilus sp.]
MDIHQLEIFLAVMDSPSITRAAEKVYLSPGAISLQLHKLADELNTELFTRNGSGKRLIPTPAALRLAESARKLVSLSTQIKQVFQNDPKKDIQPFYFSTGVTTLIYQLGEPLKQLRSQYPQTDFRIAVNPTEETIAGLEERRYDLGLISLPSVAESMKNLKIVDLFDEELLIVCSAENSAHGKQINYMRASELAGNPFLLYPKGTVLRILIDRFFEEIGMTANVVMEADDTEAIKSLVESGFGYSIIPEHALRRRTRPLKIYRVENHPIMRRLALAMVRSRYPRKLTLSVAESLRELILDDLDRSESGLPSMAVRALALIADADSARKHFMPDDSSEAWAS